jgi:hypothetical protein
MRLNYKLLPAFLLLFFNGFGQVGVGTTTPQGALDVSSSSNGMLIPRVVLTATNIAAPVVNPAGGGLINGTLVYNTTPSAAGTFAVVEGFYYWNGTIWVPVVGASASGWALTGNTGTTAGTNYLGTSDATDLRIKTGGNDRLNISNTNGQLQNYATGTATAPAYSFASDTNTGVFAPVSDNLAIATNGTEKARVTATGQLAVGTTAPQGALDITSSTNGILIPRVALTSRLVSTPIVNPVGGGLVNGTLVYNTATAGISPNSVFPGYYYWRNLKWYRMTDMVITNYVYPPTNVMAYTTYTFTGTFPDGDRYDGATVAVVGDWPTTPLVNIEYIETRTGAVKFRIYNWTNVNYLAMDFVITTFKY